VRDTPLVLVLMQAGITQQRAAAFERCLDDRPYCGISGAKLAILISLYSSSLVEQIENLQLQVDTLTGYRRKKGVDGPSTARLF
jgi:hypothetical protein